MPIQTFAHIDLLGADDFLNFICDGSSEVVIQPFQLSDLLQQGYVHDSAYDLRFPIGVSENWPKFVESTWQSISSESGALGPVYTTRKCVNHVVSVSPYALVLYDKSLDATKVSNIVKQVSTFDYARLEAEGLSYIQEIETALSSGGLSISDYYVILTVSLEKDSGAIAFDTLPSLVAVLGETYHLRLIAEKCLAKIPDSTFEDSEVVVPDVDNIADVVAELDSEIAKEAAKIDCSDLVYKHHRVGTLFQYPEFKTEWEWKKVKIGKCTVIQIPWPYTYTRTRKQVLYISVAIPSSVATAIEKAVVDCVVASAAAVGLMALITGGLSLSAAALVFEEVFTKCVKQKIGDVIKCIVDKVYIVAEYNDWHKV